MEISLLRAGEWAAGLRIAGDSGTKAALSPQSAATTARRSIEVDAFREEPQARVAELVELARRRARAAAGCTARRNAGPPPSEEHR